MGFHCRVIYGYNARGDSTHPCFTRHGQPCSPAAQILTRERAFRWASDEQSCQAAYGAGRGPGDPAHYVGTERLLHGLLRVDESIRSGRSTMPASPSRAPSVRLALRQRLTAAMSKRKESQTIEPPVWEVIAPGGESLQLMRRLDVIEAKLDEVLRRLRGSS
jgi:hypothetical protein